MRIAGLAATAVAVVFLASTAGCSSKSVEFNPKSVPELTEKDMPFAMGGAGGSQSGAPMKGGKKPPMPGSAPNGKPQ